MGSQMKVVVTDEWLYLARARLADADESLREAQAKVNEGMRLLQQAADRVDEADEMRKANRIIKG